MLTKIEISPRLWNILKFFRNWYKIQIFRTLELQSKFFLIFDLDFFLNCD